MFVHDNVFNGHFLLIVMTKKETYTKDKAAYYHIMTYNNIDKQKEIVFCTCQGVANTTVYCETNLCKMYSIAWHIFLRKSCLLVLIVVANINTYFSLIVFVYNWLHLDTNTRISILLLNRFHGNDWYQFWLNVIRL